MAPVFRGRMPAKGVNALKETKHWCCPLFAARPKGAAPFTLAVVCQYQIIKCIQDYVMYTNAFYMLWGVKRAAFLLVPCNVVVNN